MKKVIINKWEDLNQLEKYKKYQAEIIYENDYKDKRSIIFEGNSLFVFEKRARVYGRRYYNSTYSNPFNNKYKQIIAIVKTEEDIKVKWEKSLRKALSMLEESGLWEEIKEDIKNALEIGYEKIQKAKDIYWNLEKIEGESYEEWDKRRDVLIKSIDERIDNTILFYFGLPLKIEKMYFGSLNEKILKEIKEAMENKIPYRTGTIRTNYDTSFEYDPETNRAWYSKEYKGMGNGHYYLALNSTHAVFWEDD
jgi:hypothetical protein